MGGLLDGLLSFVSGLLLTLGVIGFLVVVAAFVWLFWPRRDKDQS